MKYIIALLGLILSVVGMTVDDIFINFPALVAGTVALVTFIKSYDFIKGNIAVFVSWGVGVVLTAIGYYGEIGFLAALELWQAVLVAIGVSAGSNGFYDAAKALLKALGIIKE